MEQYEGYEHAHWALSYRWEAMRAGFLTEVTEPHYRPFFGDAAYTPRPDAGRLANLLGRAAFPLRRLGLARRLYLAWLNNVWGGVSMNMIATKPRRYVGRHEQMATPERLLRSLAAGLREPIDRRRGVAPPRLPRTPEQAQRTIAERSRSGRYRFSATSGAERLNTQKPSAKSASTIATGASRAAQLPSASTALGVWWVIMA